MTAPRDMTTVEILRTERNAARAERDAALTMLAGANAYLAAVEAEFVRLALATRSGPVATERDAWLRIAALFERRRGA